MERPEKPDPPPVRQPPPEQVFKCPSCEEQTLVNLPGGVRRCKNCGYEERQ
jgi:transcription elongation factor Elf1